jgi:hypothetical protein
MKVLERLRPAIVGTAHALVGLERDASHALDTPFWRRFFDYLGRNAGPAVTGMGHVVGNLAHGFAGLLMAFEPLAHRMGRGLET